MDGLRNIASGAVAGFAATAPMTAAMVAWHQDLPIHQRDPLPPRQITERALQTIAADDDLSEESKQALSLVNHFGFGTTMGALFGAIMPVRSQTDAVLKGAAFGTGVWGASYLGWLPATGLYRPAIREPHERHALLLASHLVWGTSLGYVYYWLTGPRHRAEPNAAQPS